VLFYVLIRLVEKLLFLMQSILKKSFSQGFLDFPADLWISYCFLKNPLNGKLASGLQVEIPVKKTEQPRHSSTHRGNVQSNNVIRYLLWMEVSDETK
jgi:hypothetical protein